MKYFFLITTILKISLIQMPTSGACSVCGVNTRTYCSRCKTTLYCGQKCQKEGWKSHKPNCVEKLTSTEIKSLEFSVKILSEWIIGKNFESYDENYSLANYALMNSDPATALELYCKCKPVHDKVSPDEESQLHINKSLAHIQLGNHKEAIKEAIRSIKINPKQALAHNILSGCYKRVGRYDEAILFIKRAIELRPDVLEHYLHYMLLIIDTDKPEFARISAIVRKRFPDF